MTDEPIPGDIRDFIQRHIDSIAQLEALLLLHAHPDESWDVATAAKRLYTSEPDIAELLARLCEQGLLAVSDESYRFDELNQELRAVVDRLAQVYSRHLIPVTNMIHAKPRRIREFADAFKIRKEP